MAARDEAAARVERLAARDPLMRLLGIECLAGGPGRAVTSLAVGEHHLNFNGTCHGGVTFALADAAFGLASNSHGVIAAAIDAHVTYQVAVKAGRHAHRDRGGSFAHPQARGLSDRRDAPGRRAGFDFHRHGLRDRPAERGLTAA